MGDVNKINNIWPVRKQFFFQKSQLNQNAVFYFVIIALSCVANPVY